MTETPYDDPASPASATDGTEPAVFLDLDAIEVDLEMVETTLASLAAGTYFTPAGNVGD